MTTTEYRGYLICKKKEFGPLRLLQWVEEGEFIVTKHVADAMNGASFRTIDDAKQAIDIVECTLKRLLRA